MFAFDAAFDGGPLDPMAAPTSGTVQEFVAPRGFNKEIRSTAVVDDDWNVFVPGEQRDGVIGLIGVKLQIKGGVVFGQQSKVLLQGDPGQTGLQ